MTKTVCRSLFCLSLMVLFGAKAMAICDVEKRAYESAVKTYNDIDQNGGIVTGIATAATSEFFGVGGLVAGLLTGGAKQNQDDVVNNKLRDWKRCLSDHEKRIAYEKLINDENTALEGIALRRNELSKLLNDFISDAEKKLTEFREYAIETFKKKGHSLDEPRTFRQITQIIEETETKIRPVIEDLKFAYGQEFAELDVREKKIRDARSARELASLQEEELRKIEEEKRSQRQAEIRQLKIYRPEPSARQTRAMF